MGYQEFVGCLFLAFGPPLSIFVLTIAKDPVRVIILMTSAFFWLLSLLLSSLWWLIVVPLREKYAFALVFSVLIQEAFRFLFYVIIRKAERGLVKIQKDEHKAFLFDKRVIAYVSGFGFGLISGIFSYANVLSNMTGPGTVGLYGGSQAFFVTSALLTLCFIFLHTCWSINMYLSLPLKNVKSVRSWIPIVLVIGSHMLASCITLVNDSKTPSTYAGSIVVCYAVLIINAIYAVLLLNGKLIEKQTTTDELRRIIDN